MERQNHLNARLTDNLCSSRQSEKELKRELRNLRTQNEDLHRRYDDVREKNRLLEAQISINRRGLILID